MSPLADNDEYARFAFDHIRHILESIGGRASCSPEERQAAQYLAAELSGLGFSQVNIEPFRGAKSTYWPFAVAFGTALLGTLVGLIFNNRWLLGLGGLLNTLAVWGMWRELDIRPNWLRWLTPFGDSQNVIGITQPKKELRRQVVVCAHLDTHRAPIFYSTAAWQSAFNLLLLFTFISMFAGAVTNLLGALFDWASLRWLGLAFAPVQAFALAMCLHAHLAPLSPGANDNTSAVGVTLALAHRLAAEPLAHTEVQFVFTGCEEVGAYGMRAYLDAHAKELGSHTLILVPEQVGTGRLQLVTGEGLVLKRPVRPEALDLGRLAAAALPDLMLTEKLGEAYSDALPAMQRGLTALTITSDPKAIGEESHWHQMSDTLEHIYPDSLKDAYAFILEIILEIDRA